jgi:copper resistance protein B
VSSPKNRDSCLRRRVPAYWFCFVAALSLLSLLEARSSGAQTASPPLPTADGKHPDWGPPVRDNQVLAHALFEQLEGRSIDSSQMLRWDAQGWMGTDMNRLWIKSEGFSDGREMSDGDQEALYDRPIPRMRYFDAQVGVRADLDSGPRRAWAAVGVEGLAPWFFEFAPTLYIRDGGHIAGRVESSWELNITQRLVLEPQAELNFYSKDDESRKIGSGLADLDGGVRVRYEIRRKFAPYVGFAYSGGYNGTATYERQAGEAVNNRSFVFGLRTWY